MRAVAALRRVTTREELAEARAALPGRVAVVMTMGALHEGHQALLRRAHEISDHVIITIFVNPLQFGPGEDFASYPRDLAADLARIEAAGGADLVFTPQSVQMYPDGPPGISVSAGPAGEILEGSSRPGHFDGVLTVVTLMLNLVRPDVAVFGTKDAQQLSLIRQLVVSLGFDVSVEAVETVRGPDGLALSSRNANLSARQRRAAAAIPRALRAAVERSGAGLVASRGAALAVLSHTPGLVVDYVELVDPARFRLLRAPGDDDSLRNALLVLAVRVGRTRLIDNVVLSVA